MMRIAGVDHSLWPRNKMGPSSTATAGTNAFQSITMDSSPIPSEDIDSYCHVGGDDYFPPEGASLEEKRAWIAFRKSLTPDETNRLLMDLLG